jgi:hypothetical protein
VDIEYVRVKKPDGTLVATPPESIQDMTSEVSRIAPFYSDLREKHVAVRGLSAGDTLEYAARWNEDKPLASGQFWTNYEFVTDSIILDERLEVSFPADREVNVKSQRVHPEIHTANGRRIYAWKTSHLEPRNEKKEKDELAYETIRGRLPPPDVIISSFKSWEEVGRWYDGLQKEKAEPSPEVRAKAAEIIKGIPDEESKLRALYSYVSLNYRYIGIAFGIGRYQPHSSGDILNNQYGDCKDKHTLLAALAGAAGIRMYPALISSRGTIDAEIPTPAQFDHVISAAVVGSQTYWMDTTSEMAPFGMLLTPLRDKPALVITPEKVAFQTTPPASPFSNHEEFTMVGKLDGDGTYDADAKYSLRDDEELLMRLAFRKVPQAQWQELVQKISSFSGFGGTVSAVEADHLEKTDEPFFIAYHYNRKGYSDWDNHRILASLPPFGIPSVNDEELSRTIPLWIGGTGEWQYESHIQLPKGFSPELPQPLKLNEDFADFEGSSTFENGVLITKRRLVVKAPEVTPAQLKSIRHFRRPSGTTNTLTYN